jgi:putative two-component system response regulator
MATLLAQPSLLIVDDEALVRRTLRKSLASEGFSCEEAASADEALQCLKQKRSEVVILDIMMPGKSGIELLPEIKESFPETAVVMATAVVNPDVIIQCMKEGAQDYITKPFDVDRIVDSIRQVLAKRNLELDLNKLRNNLQGKIDDQTRAIQKTFSGAVESLISALEAKDLYTGGHSRRVTDIAEAIGKKICLSDDELEDLHWAALLHDIGKIGIDPKIQNKPGNLTPDEYRYILSHCCLGPGIVQTLVNKNIIAIISHHHDHYDGSGPGQIVSGESIPMGSRIIAVADTFDAMTSTRPYRSALPPEAAIDEIKRCIATQFDPKVVKAFLELSLYNIDVYAKTYS